MKPFIIICKDAQQYYDVQKIMFASGWSWRTDHKVPLYTGVPHLGLSSIDVLDDGTYTIIANVHDLAEKRFGRVDVEDITIDYRVLDLRSL